MRWPLMRRRTHMRLHIAQGEAYRRSVQEARWEAERARLELRSWVDSLAPRLETYRDFPSQNLRILVEVDRHVMVRNRQHDLLLLVRDSIMRRLVELERDYRGDLRQTPTQRALGL